MRKEWRSLSIADEVDETDSFALKVKHGFGKKAHLGNFVSLFTEHIHISTEQGADLETTIQNFFCPIFMCITLWYLFIKFKHHI